MRPLALSAVLALAACSGEDPVDAALRDASAARQAATVKEGAVSVHAGHGATAATAGDAAFAASEKVMHEAMAKASGATVDEAYIAKMIAHHEGAVAMANVALKESSDPEIRRMARAVVDAQTREIAEMKAWKPTAAPAG